MDSQPPLSTDPDRAVHSLLKVLGKTRVRPARVIHRTGEKVCGYPVDNRWTTVDNFAVRAPCGQLREFYTGFSTANPPVHKRPELGKAEFSTVCTGATKTMGYLF
ncbi:hypothetical protein GCM10012279_18340 [Micromonospora yangpuensis]|nr:hypothetical protein GCM10012279_18340 [Micromonospora yangpuensis]